MDSKVNQIRGKCPVDPCPEELPTYPLQPELKRQATAATSDSTEATAWPPLEPVPGSRGATSSLLD
jgi:hypothetical protein